jgi:(1->4)-alpha-D-glucan 1-alpha-D-glucosylmutase
VTRWRRDHRELKTRVRGRLAPDANTEYLLYQTLVGMWPLARGGTLPSEDERAALRERLEGYMLKAVREAKAQTSWTDPNLEFERALAAFIRALFARESSFLAELTHFAHTLARAGIWNALSRTLVHCTAPGTPDVYQGDELWNFALVDPDNRRPVDFDRRDCLLAELERVQEGARQAHLRELVDSAEDGRIKLHVMHSAMSARRVNPALFTRGTYEPLYATGSRAEHVFAFLRRDGEAAVITVAPRLTNLLSRDGNPPVDAPVWGDTALQLPSELSPSAWRCVLGGHIVETELNERAPAIPLSRILRVVPVSLLVSGDGRNPRVV